jgi:hypothetical protein
VKAFIKVGNKKVFVTNGQLVEIELDDDVEIEWDDGILEVSGPKIVLVVKAKDIYGEVDKAKAKPIFNSD